MKKYCCSSLLVFLCLVAVDANCNLKSQIRESDAYGDMNFNDTDLLGGNQKIDKITKIKVFGGNYLTNYVVSRIITTYKLKDGNERDIARGEKGEEIGQFVLKEGQYLKKIEMKRGRYVDWIRFTDTDGNMSSKFGGNKDLGESQVGGRIFWQNGVIKSLRGQEGAVIDRIMAWGELNQIYSARMLDPDYELTSEEIDDSMRVPDGRLAVDNLTGLTQPQTQSMEISETLTTREVTTVTKSTGYSTSVETTAFAGINFKFFSAGVESTFQVGSSWSNTLEETHERTISTTVKKNIVVTAPPRTLAIADIYYNVVHYEFSWEAPTVCTYTYAPKTNVNGDSFEGTISGSQPFQDLKVVISYEYAPTVPPAPGPMPTTATLPVAPPPSSDKTQPAVPVSEPSVDPPVSGESSAKQTLVTLVVCFVVMFI